MLICLGSVKGSPGVTTLSIAVAACWPDGWQRVVVEADPAGGDLAARFGLSVTPGLVSLAAAARHDTDPELIDAHTQRLSEGGLPVVVGPTGPAQARAALLALCSADGQAGVLGRFASRADGIAVVDCGRLEPDSATSSLLAAAGVVLLVVRPLVDELAHAATYAASAREASNVRLLLAGEGYDQRDVTREVGLPVMASIPQDRRTADTLSGRGTRRASRRAALVRAATQLAGQLATETPRAPSAPGSAVSANGQSGIGVETGIPR